MTYGSGFNPSESLILLQQKLEQFRSARRRPTRLPEALWRAAVEMARHYGVCRTARQLRLDYSCLKKRLGGTPKQERATASFVELLPRPAKPEEGIIELETATGSKMRIQWKANLPPDWTMLLRAWREAER
jgi:hypothetical protein